MMRSKRPDSSSSCLPVLKYQQIQNQKVSLITAREGGDLKSLNHMFRAFSDQALKSRFWTMFVITLSIGIVAGNGADMALSPMTSAGSSASSTLYTLIRGKADVVSTFAFSVEDEDWIASVPLRTS